LGDGAHLQPARQSAVKVAGEGAVALQFRIHCQRLRLVKIIKTDGLAGFVFSRFIGKFIEGFVGASDKGIRPIM
jgi:hypothetical protein